MEEDIKNLSEIIELCREELDNNNENTHATLDLLDLKSLDNLLKRYKELERNLRISDSYLKLLLDVNADYDGYFDEKTRQGSVIGLAGLIDENTDYIKKALYKDDKSAIYEDINSRKFNVLFEKI